MLARVFLSLSFEVSRKRGFLETMNEIDPDGSMFMFLMAFLLIVPVALIFVLVWAVKRNNSLLGTNDLQTCQRLTVVAKVMSKRDLQPGGNIADPFSHIIFECKDGQRLDFAFKANDPRYHGIVIGDVGSLTYAGKAFVDFRRIVDR